MKAAQITALILSAPKTRDRIGEPYSMRPGKYREIVSTWEVGPGNTHPDDDRYGDDGTIVLDMRTTHCKDRKRYTTEIRVSIEYAGGSMTTLSFGTKGESMPIHRAPVERFSAKTMRQHHDAARGYSVLHADLAGATLEQGVAQYLAKASPKVSALIEAVNATHSLNESGDNW